MADRELMPIDWMHYLRQRASEREDEILQKMLQVPKYPPLPECPTCDVAPERIVQRMADPGAEEAVLIDFRPCGHGFKVPASELLHG